jgi:flagellar basal-body rod protein FlgG
MDLALMIAKSGLDAHHKSIEVISNNLANANTTGFKKNRAEFEELPYQIIQQPGSATSDGVTMPVGVTIGTGAKLSNNSKIFTDGSQITTDKALDIAIKGRGFLQVQLPNGSDFAYTRAGSLRVNEQGQITLPNGYLVQPPITIPTGVQKITIAEDGTVSVVTSTSTTEQTLGQIQLADFINPDGLEPIGQNLYQVTAASGQPTLGNPTQSGLGSIQQGALEGSNVNVVEEMVNLIEAQRAFEVTSKAVSAVDSMLQYLNQAT